MGKALLIIILGFSFIFGSMMMNVTSNHQRSSNAIVQQYEKWIARNAVESATNVANSKLFRNFDWRTGFTNQSFSGAGYSVTVTDITGDSTTEAKKIEVKTIVNYENVIDSTIAVFIQPAYSYYYFFLENWPPGATLEYDSGDTLRGRIHANDKIRIRDYPVFLAKVSSSDDTYQKVSSPNPKFYGGVEFGTANIALDESILTPLENFASSSPAADSYGIEIWVEFTGTAYDVYSDATYSTLINTNNLTDIKVIYSTETIHVKGTVDGQITVFSDTVLFIEDDIVCDNNPSTDPLSDDFIGLIADRQIFIADNPDNQSDLVIHAAIMPRNDEILVQDLGGPTPRGTLTIVGSIIEQDYHDSIATDYVLDHIADSRLLDKTPPYFPRLDRVEMVFRSD